MLKAWAYMTLNMKVLLLFQVFSGSFITKIINFPLQWRHLHLPCQPVMQGLTLSHVTTHFVLATTSCKKMLLSNPLRGHLKNCPSLKLWRLLSWQSCSSTLISMLPWILYILLINYNTAYWLILKFFSVPKSRFLASPKNPEKSLPQLAVQGCLQLLPHCC